MHLGRCWVSAGLALILSVAPSRADAESLASADPTPALDEALAEVRTDYQARLQVVAQADAYLAANPDAPDLLRIKTRLVEGVANLRLGRLELSRDQFDALCPSIPASVPNLRFRCQSMQAALKLVLGDRVASLAAYEALFEQDLSGVEPGLKSRARINYAAVLSENGRSAEAADIYEQQMVVAISGGDDPLALYAGNNLVVILITQGDHLAARETLDQLRDVLARNPDSLVKGSLRLHDLELMRVAGKPEEAIAGLKEFIRLRMDPSPLMMGSAHKLLADALREVQAYDEALKHADTALLILDEQASELTEVRLTRASILLDQANYNEVLAQLGQIDIEAEAVPARRVRAYSLELAARLLRNGDVQSAGALAALSRADLERDRLASTTRSEYFDARLTAARRSLEVEQAEATAAAALEHNKADRVRRNQTLVLIGIAAVVTCLLVYLLVNRRAERHLLREKEAQNEELGALVAAKTRELTDNLNAQAEMARALERKKRAEAVGLLAGNVAHDFNNLLQVIASSNETLSNPQASDEEKTAVLEISSNSMSHASRIIRQLLAYSRQQDLASHPVHFSEYLQDTQALLLSAAGEENDLEIEDQSGNAAVLVDPAQLTTALLNLISNATDAISGGGQVTISSEVRSIDALQAGRWNDIEAGDFLVLGVQDNGSGMTAEQVARASEPFFTTKSLQFGTGLGLSSVYGFVKQSGGDLVIHSFPNEGTLVQILLPLTKAARPTLVVDEPPASVQLDGKRVLLVEDNESVATLLESVLSHLGLQTVRTSSGEEAKTLLELDAAFDYVLSDVRMPGQLDGPALARWIQQELPSVRVMLMSGFNELGADDTDLPLISKPFNIEQLKRFMAEQGAAA